MRNLVLMFVGALALCSCSTSRECTQVSKFTTEMNLLKTHHPELYNEYMTGELVVDEVYEEKLYGEKASCVCYHKIKFVSSGTR